MRKASAARQRLEPISDMGKYRGVLGLDELLLDEPAKLSTHRHGVVRTRRQDGLEGAPVALDSLGVGCGRGGGGAGGAGAYGCGRGGTRSLAETRTSASARCSGTTE